MRIAALAGGQALPETWMEPSVEGRYGEPSRAGEHMPGCSHVLNSSDHIIPVRAAILPGLDD